MAYRLVPPQESSLDDMDNEPEIVNDCSPPEFCAVTSVESGDKKKELVDLLLWNFKVTIVQTAVNGLHGEKSCRAYLTGVASKKHTLSDGREVHFTLKTMERWVRDFKNSGKDTSSLLPKTRKDKGVGKKLSPKLIEEIKRLLEKTPTACATVIFRDLVDRHMMAEDTVCVETIRRLIRNNGLRSKITKGEVIRHSFIFSEAGQLWEADTCYFLKIWAGKDKVWVYVQGIIDNHSRFIVAAKCYLEDTAENFRKTLMDALLHHHIPRMLLLDNGGPYIDKTLLEICGRLGIAIVHTKSGDGAAKGVVERWWRSLETWTIIDIARENPATVEEVQKLVDKWVTKYHTRVNTGVNGRPLDRLIASLRRHVVHKMPSKEWLYDMFLHEDTVTVYSDTVIRVGGKWYRLPDELAFEKKLLVRYDPDHIKETIYVLFEKKKYYLKEDDREANAHEPRNHGGRKAELREREEAKKKKKAEQAQEQEQKMGEDELKARMESTMTPEARELLKEAKQALLRDGETDPKTLEEARAEERYSRRMAGSSILQQSQDPEDAPTVKFTLNLMDL